MKKILIAATVALLAAITVATSVGQDHLLAAFASNDIILQIVRVVLIVLLAGLLLSSPPRSMHFRTILGVVSGLLTLSVLVMLERYAIRLLDAALFVEVAIIFALESIESPEAAKRAGTKIPVVYRPQKEKITI